jgi:chlorite dismutase
MAAPQLPAVPLTLDGASVLHQMLRFRWPEWRALDVHARQRMLDGFYTFFEGQRHSAIYALLGHKGDLLLLHFRNSFDELGALERCLTKAELWPYLEQTSSYLSVVELGLYESSVKTYRSLIERGVHPHSEEWHRETSEVLARQREAMRPRLFPEIPAGRYLCFYPMDRRRGEQKNWYVESLLERQRMMEEHGEVGRRYAAQVRQIISGSIGFDDWEWGVDLFADDPLVFKRLIYEMRFDEVSAVYALFGAFYVGRRLDREGLLEFA